MGRKQKRNNRRKNSYNNTEDDDEREDVDIINDKVDSEEEKETATAVEAMLEEEQQSISGGSSGTAEEDEEDESNNNKQKKNKKKQQNGKKGEKIDFATRREIQRKQAAEKRRSKMKCYLCGKAGHVRRECPGIQDDGRGMSRYKGKSNAKHEKEKYYQKKYGTTNTNTNNNSNDLEASATLPKPLLEYPEEFLLLRDQDQAKQDNFFLYYDVCCDVTASLDYIKQHAAGRKKISQKEALLEYQKALIDANTHTNFGGMITKSLLKPNRPWNRPTFIVDFDFSNHSLEDQDQQQQQQQQLRQIATSKTWYIIGLGRDFLYNDNDVEGTVQVLMDTLMKQEANYSQDSIIGYWSTLDYSPKYCQRPGCDVESQKRRLEATLQAAGKMNVPIQIQILPSAPAANASSSNNNTNNNDDNNDDDDYYKQVLLELGTILSQTTRQFPNLNIILMDWDGLPQHMLTLLKNLSNLYIGLNGSVSFHKATNLHECSFEIPINRLVLGTSTIIPSNIMENNNNTKTAATTSKKKNGGGAGGTATFFHSGLWCFVAKAVANYKKNLSIEEIARSVSETTLRLYPQLSSSSSQQSTPAAGPGDDDEHGSGDDDKDKQETR